jgi:hypothetical protein
VTVRKKVLNQFDAVVEEVFFKVLMYSIGMTLKSKSFIEPSRYKDKFMVKILAFYDATFGCFAADGQTEYPYLITLL